MNRCRWRREINSEIDEHGDTEIRTHPERDREREGQREREGGREKGI